MSRCEAEWARTSHAIVTLTWSVAALGVILRMARYGQNAPLWWNEAFVAVNFLDRNYLDLLKPLDYGQVCPLGFLWIEKAIVDLFGFAEWTLRLYPLVAGIAALGLFARLALRVLPGPSAFLAVCVLSMAYHPIRLGSEAKPYASDLLAAVVVLELATARGEVGAVGSRRSRRLLIFLTPVLIFLSHPVIFVLGGVWIGLARNRAGPLRDRRRTWLALGVSIAAGFGLSYELYTKGQSASTLESMRAYWNGAFPPVGEPVALLGWMLRVHTGRMMAYPVGGAHAGSVLTFVLVMMGLGRLAREHNRRLLSLLLLPFALTLAASVLQRHPYGGHPRVTQHLAPSVCLLVGVGLDSIRSLFQNPARRQRVLAMFASVLLLAGFVPMASEWSRPYRSEVEEQARLFARRNWAGESPGLVSLRGKITGAPRVSVDPDVPLMLCNLRISARKVITNGSIPLEMMDRPVRFVLDYSPRLESPDIDAFLDQLRDHAGSVRATEESINLGRGPRRMVSLEVQPRRRVALRPGRAIADQKASP